VILVGFHSKYGTPGGLLHHSYELDIRDLRLNGVSVGEIGMETAIAGDFGVPLILVTADSAGCAEAEALVPGTRTVAVKESLGETGGGCLPLAVTAAMIREAAKDIVQNPPAAKPWTLGADVTLTVSLNPGPYADAVRRLYADDLDDNGALVIKGDTATAVWAEYWQRKLKAHGEIRQNH
jgi:D-amino peptidase